MSSLWLCLAMLAGAVLWAVCFLMGFGIELKSRLDVQAETIRELTRDIAEIDLALGNVRNEVMDWNPEATVPIALAEAEAYWTGNVKRPECAPSEKITLAAGGNYTMSCAANQTGV